jgi:hypothetical protein
MCSYPPTPIIRIPSLGDLSAVAVVEELGIKSQNDKDLLIKAKDICYMKGFYEGNPNSFLWKLSMIYILIIYSFFEIINDIYFAMKEFYEGNTNSFLWKLSMIYYILFMTKVNCCNKFISLEIINDIYYILYIIYYFGNYQ